MEVRSSAVLSAVWFWRLNITHQQKKCPDLIPGIHISVTLQGLQRYYKYPDARGGSSQHRQDSHFQAWGKKNNKNFKLFTALVHEPFQPFKVPVRIAIPSAFYAALQKVQHRATKMPTLSRL